MLGWFRKKSRGEDEAQLAAETTGPEATEGGAGAGTPESPAAPEAPAEGPAPESVTPEVPAGAPLAPAVAPASDAPANAEPPAVEAPAPSEAPAPVEAPAPDAVAATSDVAPGPAVPGASATPAVTEVADLREALASELAADAAAAPAPAYEPFATAELEAIQQSLATDATAAELPPVDADAAFAQQETSLLPAGAAAQTAAAPLPIEEQPPSEIDLGPDRRSGMWVWIGLVIGMLAAAGAIGYAWWYTTARPIPVPAVIGKASPQAVQQLNDAGLRLGRVSEEPTDTAAVGEVIDQEPQATTKLKPGDLVSLVVAASPKTTEVPEVTGRNRDDALSQLASKSLSAKIVESFDSSAPANTVISQIPTAGAELKPGSMIALAVSKGSAPSTVRMPKLIGLKQTDADALLKASNLRGTVFHSYNASITVGEIYAQAPLADTSVAYDSWTQYLVSDGSGTSSVTLPSVVGATRKVAEQRIKDRGLKVIVRQSPHLSVPKGQVVSQIPAGNSKVARGATVGLIVSRGSTNTTSVPDFIGLSSMDASMSAGTAGFTPEIVEVPISGHTAGMVFGQWPAPGTLWTRRFPVMIVTARLP